MEAKCFRGLCPGPAAEEVKAAFDEPIPDAVAEWFSWSNGVAYTAGQTQDDSAVVPGYWPLSIDEAKAIRAEHVDDEGALGDHWVPLLATGGGDFYAAVFEESAREARVFSVMEGGDTRFAFRSIEKMVDGFLELHRTSVFFVAGDGSLEADDERWIEYESRVGDAAS